MKTQNALELLERIEKVLGFSIYRLCGCEGFIAGRTVYEFVLYKMGKIPTCNFHSFEVYIKDDGTNLKSEIESRGVSVYYYEGDRAKEEVLKEKYPLNIQKIILSINGFKSSREFKKFLKTGQLQISLYSVSELLVLETLIYFEKLYKGKFYVDKNKELLKLAVLNRNKPYGSKLFPIPEDWKTVLTKYAMICKKRNVYFLETIKEESNKYIPKNRKRFQGYQKHIIEFWDVIYGGAKKIIRINYEHLKKYQLEHIFSSKGLENWNSQIPEKEILTLKKYLRGYNLLFLVNKDNVDKTFENFFYLKLLEEDYGKEAISFVENNQNLSLEIIHTNLINSSLHEFVPMVEPFNLNGLKTSKVQIRELVSRFSLKKEGNDMHHCVGGYELNSSRRIFSLRSGKLRSTLQINFENKKWKIVQNNSFCNRAPEEILRKAGSLLCRYVNKVEKERKTSKEISNSKNITPDLVQG